MNLINLQIAAVNNTIAKNIFVPYVDNGTVKLVSVTKDPNFNPNNSTRLCVIYNQTQSQDIQAYLRAI